MPRPVRMLSLVALALALVLVIGLVGEAVGCPNCKEAVANQDGDAMRLANGYSWSILLMVSMPFALLGSGVLMIARAVRRGGFPDL